MTSGWVSRLARVFYFYGGKRRLARFYPGPDFRVVIEPFAGSAAYSVTHLMPVKGERAVDKVILIEKDKRVYDTWVKLLAMDVDDVLNYPIPNAGERTSDFLVMTSACSNRIARTEEMTVTTRMPVVLKRMFKQIAAVLPHVKDRVEIIHGNYTDAENTQATWFIDPPYHVNGRPQQRGMGYAEGCNSASLDYEELAEWCRSRCGQKIVCEQDGADWLPFEHLRWARDSIGNQAAEVVWVETARAAKVQESPVTRVGTRVIARGLPSVRPAPA
jgi:site-specific DNA-adenine methylase